MTSAETIAQIKDIVLIIFLIGTFAILVYTLVLYRDLHRRLTSFMDRMEHVAVGFEETFGRVAVVRKAVEEAAAVLKPVAQGLGMLGLFRGVGKMFGSKESTKEDSISDQD
jgi:beta-lactamase regulating signal transducer with metallopeptidase domain